MEILVLIIVNGVEEKDMIESYLQYLETFMQSHGTVNAAQARQLIDAVRENNAQIEKLKQEVERQKALASTEYRGFHTGID